MKNQQSSYRQIMKATSIFGGVQVFNILISIIRSKFVAVLLGPAGMGIMGLLNSTIGLISSITNFGLGTSAVKDISIANNTGDNQRIALVATVFRRLVWMTGILGAFSVAILSPWLSQLTFGNKNYTLAFLWISITLLFKQLSSGQLVILQGLRKLQYLAKANVLGSFLGLFITLPLYYLYGVDGIVPGIIGSSFMTLTLSWLYSRKVVFEKVTITGNQLIHEGKNMLQLGFMISLSGLLAVGASYLVRIFISRTGGVEQVGLYNAGFALINTYVGLIFNAMATDYYPRLSSVAHDNILCKQRINQQAEIALLILSPILIIFLFFINWVVILLYSSQFVAINSMIYWAALGIFFKAPSWCIGFIFLAKGDGKIFFWSELTANLYILLFNLLGYHYWGLTGLGLSFLVSYFLVLLQVFFISKIKFAFSFEIAFLKIFIFQFGLAIISFLIITFLPKPYSYFIGVGFIIVSGWNSIKELNKRLGFLSILKNFFKNDK